MTDSLEPGTTGTPLPRGVTVLRLAKLSMGILESRRAHESHFSLSSDDEKSELKSLSVWAKDLTASQKARELMGESRFAYRLVLYLNVDNIRSIQDDFPFMPLNVVWDLDPRPGAEGHAGIIGLMRPPSGIKAHYKALRVRLADIVNANDANIEILPEMAR